MSISMPEPDQRVLWRRAEIAAALRGIVPGEGVIDDPDGLRPYESDGRSEEHTSELQSLMRISYAVFCLKKKKRKSNAHTYSHYYDTRQPTSTRANIDQTA